MHAHPYASAAFALVTHWAVGVAATAAIADTESGMIRDHPSYGRRLCTVVVPPLVATGLLIPFLISGHFSVLPPDWILLSIPLLLPFAYLSRRWSRAWLKRTPASHRRRLGIIAVSVGLVGIIVSGQIAIFTQESLWRPVIPATIFFSTAALLGSLTHFSLLALTAALPSEVPSGTARHVAEVAAAGLLATLLAGADMGLSLLGSDSPWPPLAVVLGWLWMMASLAVPGSLLLARLYLKRLPDASIMTAALVCVLIGQAAALLLVFLFPGLAPPIPEVIPEISALPS